MTGKSHDWVIDIDALGPGCVYAQARRYDDANTVGREVQGDAALRGLPDAQGQVTEQATARAVVVILHRHVSCRSTFREDALCVVRAGLPRRWRCCRRSTAGQVKEDVGAIVPERGSPACCRSLLSCPPTL